jgi:hypothetical protein
MVRKISLVKEMQMGLSMQRVLHLMRFIVSRSRFTANAKR